MSECVFCEKVMGSGTKPRYVIDWEKSEVQGRAHTTCARKGKENIRYYPPFPPNEEQIKYTAILKHIIEEIDSRNTYPWDQLDFQKYLLLCEVIFKVANQCEFASHPKVGKLLDWWLNGSKIITLEQHQALIEWMESSDCAEERTEAGT